MNYKPLGRPGETSSSANENGHHYNNYGASIEEISNREGKRLATIVGAFMVFILTMFYLFVEYPEQVFELKEDVQYVFYVITLYSTLIFAYYA